MAVVICKRDLNPLGNGSNKENAERRKKKGVLHYDEVFELDKDKLLKNPKITRERRYTEHCMRKLYKGYKKDAYRANEFVKRIDKAIENEKQFCEDIGALEYSVGSNIGCLITELRQN